MSGKAYIHKTGRTFVLLSAAFLAAWTWFVTPVCGFAQENVLRFVLSRGHETAVTCSAVSPDGKFAVTGDVNGRIILHSLPGGGEIAVISGHSGPVRALDFHPGGGYLLSAGEDGSLLLRDMENLAVTASYEGSAGALLAAAFSADGTMIAAAGKDRILYLWNFGKGTNAGGAAFIRPSARFPDVSPHTDSVTGIAFSGDGKYLVSSGRDGTVRIVERRTGLIRTIIRENRGIATAVVAEREQFRFACAFQDGSLILYDGRGDAVRSFLGHRNSVNTLALSPDGSLLASGDENGNLMLWELDTGKLIFSVVLGPAGVVSVAFLPYSNIILGASADGSVKLIDASTGRVVKDLGDKKTSVVSVAADGDGEHFSLGLSDGGVLYWNLSRGRPVRYLPGGGETVTALDLSPAGTLLAAAAGTMVTLWDCFTGKALGTFDGHADTVQSLVFLDEGAALLSGGMDYSARVWNTADFKETFKLSASPRAYVTNLLSSPFNTYVYSGGLYGLSMWDRKDGKVLKAIPATLEDGHAAAIHPKGTFVATAGKNEAVKIRDSFTGHVYASFGTDEGARSPLRWSPDGGQLLTGDINGGLVLWDTATEKIVRNFSAEGGRVQSALFLRNGTLVLGTTEDGSVQIWEKDSGKTIMTIYALGGEDWIVFTPDGRFDCSLGGMQKFLFVEGLRSYEPRYFAASLYTPYLAALAWPKNDAGQGAADLAWEKISVSLALSPPPELYLEHKISSDWRESGKADLLVHVTDTGGGIEHVGIFHNGKPVRDSGMLSPGNVPGVGIPPAGTSLTPANGAGDFIFRFLVPLLPGENDFYAVASSAADLAASSNRISVFWEQLAPDSGGELQRPSLYAVVVAAGAYDNIRLKAAYPSVDGRAVAQVLDKIRGKEGNGQMGDVFAYRFFENAARKTDIMKALSEIAGKARPEDIFLFYYAGCFTSMEGEGVFLLPGPQGAGPFGARGRELVVSAAELSDALIAIQARSQLLLMDAFRPVQEARDVLTDLESAETKSLILLGESAGINIAAAIGSDPFSADLPELGNGVLTRLLLSAVSLDAEAAGQDDQLEISELFSYIEKRYPRETFTVLGRERYPVLYKTGYDIVRGSGK